jgi:hypothetical protein
MKALLDLGFTRYRSLDPVFSQQFLKQTGYTIPSGYLEFLCFRQPTPITLAFKFIRSDGLDWEGCVSEFDDIVPTGGDLTGLENCLIRRPDSPSRAFLPIGSDPGGNLICIELSKPGQPVVDIDYGSGEICDIAPSFDAFVNALYRIDEL